MSYKKRQAELREAAKQAQKDAHAARQSINEQNAQALPAKGKQAALPATASDEVLDLTEMQKPRKKLCRRNCRPFSSSALALVEWTLDLPPRNAPRRTTRCKRSPAKRTG